MCDSPGVAVGHQGVAVATDVVEPDMRDDGEVARHQSPVGSHFVEKQVGDVVPDDRLDVSGECDVAGDAAEECHDLRSTA